MKLRNPLRRAALAAALVLASSIGVARAETKVDASVATSVSVITQPSETHKLSFPQAGIVREKLAKDGDHVKAGDVLLRQDTDLDVKELERLKVEADSTSRIEAAEADKKVKQIEYDRKSKAPDSYAASEIEEAEAKLIEAEKSIKVAQEDHQQAVIKHDQQAVKIKKMELGSPVDGVVQNIVVDTGEMADPQSRDGAVVVVKNDPLWVEVRGLTTLQVSTLRIHDKLQVRYKNDGPAAKWLEAEVIYKAPVADAGADRQLVRLSLPNADGRDSGQRMELKYTEQLQKTAPPPDEILSFTR
jgi:multidrug efflux pump subunit AcrA (membrane-fusion protein)